MVIKKLIVVQLVKKLSALYRYRMFIAVLTRMMSWRVIYSWEQIDIVVVKCTDDISDDSIVTT
jgi:hypothetical protein